jgi:NADPH-dependent 2,4-dienoyl-CoA reductase/sulfur reductase-like enzyme
MTVDRRQFGKMLGAAAFGLGFGSGLTRALADTRPRVVVIGGGPGGATVARYLAKDGDGKINVTLIEPTRRYYTCFFTNLYIGGFREYESIGHSYEKLAVEFGINVVHDWALSIDRAKKTVTLGSGGTLGYDALVVAPGIDIRYDSVPGYSVEGSHNLPHAWKSATPAQLLRARIKTMKEGGTFVMLAPPNPYRCPPGPYERVSMIAHHFKQHNPRAKIIVLDPKDKFSKMELFKEGWKRHYGDMVEWQPLSSLGGLQRVDTDALTFTTGLDTFKADAGSVIPAMTGGRIARDAGLCDDAGWAPVNAASMQSQKDPSVYVVGDATIATPMPKSGFSANSQAKVAAQAIRAQLIGARAFPARFANTCWSFIEIDDGIKVGATYKPNKGAFEEVSTVISKVDETAEVRQQTYAEFFGWYKAISADIWGENA